MQEFNNGFCYSEFIKADGETKHFKYIETVLLRLLYTVCTICIIIELNRHII